MLATLAALAATLTLAAPASPAPETKAPPAQAPVWAAEVAAMFQAGNLDGISARFTPKFASLLSPEDFKDGWVGIEGRVGKLVSIGAPVVRKAGTVDTAVMLMKFEKADWTLTLAFEPDGRIDSVRFTPMALPSVAPRGPVVEFRAPPYAVPAKFRDLDVKVGAEPWVLPATLSMPTGKGPFPAVVLVHGAGAHDQDETIGGVKVFRDLAWGLASQGIAVLRYDKRSFAHGNKVGSAPVTVKDEVIDDALAAVKVLRETKGIDGRRIVVIGHSLGGNLAPRIAREDGHLAGVVSLAGSTQPIHELILDQADHLEKTGAASDAELKAMRDDAAAIKALSPTRPPPPGRVVGVPPGYWLDLRAYDAPATAHTNGIPILVLQGGRDYQVNERDLEGWKQGLSGDKFATIRTFPKADHLFVSGEGQAVPADPTKPGNVDAEVVKLVAKWIRGLPPRK